MNRNLVSKWYDKKNLNLLYDVLEAGDLVEFKRKGYSHWAVYLGLRSIELECGEFVKPCVMHRSLPSEEDRSTLRLLSGSASASSTGANIGPIIVETLEDVLGNDQVCINNDLDRKWEPFDPAEIIARAESLMAATVVEVYSVVKNNCEHFANRCRYGRKYSRQVIARCVSLGTTSLGVAGILARIARATPLIAAAGPGAVAAVTAVGAVATVIPLAIEAVKASRSISATSNR